MIRIYDINRRDPKAISNGGIFAVNSLLHQITSENNQEYPIIRKIKVNSKGDQVVIVANGNISRIQYPVSSILKS